MAEEEIHKERPKKVHKALRLVSEVTHQSYFILVAIEAHGHYRWPALVLFLIGLVSYFVHITSEGGE